jgi:hypothetical protein
MASFFGVTRAWSVGHPGFFTLLFGANGGGECIIKGQCAPSAVALPSRSTHDPVLHGVSNLNDAMQDSCRAAQTFFRLHRKALKAAFGTRALPSGTYDTIFHLSGTTSKPMGSLPGWLRPVGLAQEEPRFALNSL